ncbi:MAG TPA: hypothetical protein VFI93_01445 [Rhizomicrobium sp.]|nr:hypothetical protein [Rhizomicrobium sp.]
MPDSDPGAPWERFYDLSDLSDAGDEINVTLDDETRKRVAQWAEIESVERFDVRIILSRTSHTHFGYEAELTADVTQSCVVTLEPVQTHIERAIHRDLYLPPRVRRSSRVEIPETLIISPDDEEGPEEIASPRYDLAVPLLEEFSLALPPYPRAKGIVFEPPKDSADVKQSPFAVLAKLKDKKT